MTNVLSCCLFRYTDGTGQLNFGFAADLTANQDHFLSLSSGLQFNGMFLGAFGYGLGSISGS